MKTLLPVPHVLGGHCASSAFRDLLAFQHQPDPALGEALLFALAGGLDFLYWRRPGQDPPIYLLGRTGPLEAQLVARLGGTLTLVRPPSAEAAWAWLRGELVAGRPALVLGDVGELPYLHARIHFTRHLLLVVGIDDSAGTLAVLDNDREGVQEITQAAFEAAWSSQAFPDPTDHRYYDIRWPARLPDLGARLRAELAETVRQLDGGGTAFLEPGRYAGAGGTGLAGLAGFVADLPRWAMHFPGGELTQALRAVYLYVEKAGTGFGGFFRGIYGRGLGEAAALVADQAVAVQLRAASTHYEALGRAWTDFAAACRASAPAAPADPPATLDPLADQAAALLAVERAGRALLAAL